MQNNIWIKRYFKPINSLGYRDTEPKTETGKKNILVIGDSFVAGHGIKHEEMFTFLISEQLKKDYLVFNLGVCGSHTDREFDSLMQYPVKPDIIILAYYHNDIESAMIKLNKTPKIENPKDKLNGLSRLFVNNSLFANFLFSNYAKKQISSQFMESPNNDILAYLDDSLWGYQVTALDKFNNYCLKNRIPLLIINFPTLNEGITIVNRIAGNKIEDYCLQNQIEFINIYDYVIDMPMSKRIANPMDNHPSAEVNKIVSNLLIEKIREIDILPTLYN
ncbi:MAG: SGNH/GDSL hydrolase family protein [Bacteroidales bacterium]|nr:SGNH/GDSL hydrolase family protein [Bacteroidales bacterium]